MLSNNVAIHLCLDIGALRKVKVLSTMTYPKISMDSWLTVLKGKALELFRGCMGAGLGLTATDIDFEQCAFNFVVPSNKTLRNILNHTS